MIEEKMIYKYSSFVELLNSWVLLQREEKGDRFSLGMLSRRLELTSSAEIINILKKRRPVSHKILKRIKDYWSLEQKDSYYIDLIAEKDRNLANDVLNSLIEEKISEIRGEEEPVVYKH